MRSNSLTRDINLVCASAIKNPSISIENFDSIDNKDYAVVFSSAFKSDYTFDQYNQAFNELTESAFSIQPDSLLKIENNIKPVFRCIARGNVESRAYTEEDTKGLISVRANVFMDESDKIWQLEGTGENRRLVRISREDYESILNAKRSRSPVISSISATINHNTGDYVYFFNHEFKAMDFGFAVERNNKEYVFTRSGEKLIELRTPLQVIVAHDETNPNRNPSYQKDKMILSKDYSFEGYLDYLKKLYADTPYYKAIEQSVRKYMSE